MHIVHCTNKKLPTWNPDCEQVVVTEALVRCQSLVSALPAGGIPVAGHGLDHHDAQGEVSFHRFLIVMDRLAPLGGIFGCERFVLVFLKAAKLVPGNAPSILFTVLYRVAGRVLVTEEVGVLEEGINAPHLSRSKIKPCC